MPKGGEKRQWLGVLKKRGENTYRLIVSTGKNLDGSRAKRTKQFMVLAKMQK